MNMISALADSYHNRVYNIYNVYCCLFFCYFGFLSSFLGRKYASLINFTHQHFGYRLRFRRLHFLGNNFVFNKIYIYIYPHILYIYNHRFICGNIYAWACVLKTSNFNPNHKLLRERVAF